MLPDGSGLDLLKELRNTYSNIPVLMLTALNTPEDVVRGLKSGGDDYMPKPFNIEEFAARVEALMRRAERVPETIVKGRLKIDVAADQAFLNGLDMLLTQKEFSLLFLFVQHEGRTMSAEYLYEKVWGYPMGGDNRTLKKHLSNLRKKLEEGRSGYQITAARGEGYCFEKT
jgi:DNA-binding response OmpR family regulator